MSSEVEVEDKAGRDSKGDVSGVPVSPVARGEVPGLWVPDTACLSPVILPPLSHDGTDLPFLPNYEHLPYGHVFSWTGTG